MKVKKAKAEVKVKPAALWPYYAAISAILLYIGFEVYGPALHGPFVYDDFSLPFYNPLFRGTVLLHWISGVRPLLMFTYWLNYHFSGKDTFSYHLVNVLFHLGNAAAVFFIARRILPAEVADRPKREIVGAFASALFLLHPVQTESVAWVAGRSESMAAFFFLWAFAIYLYRPTDSIGWGRSVAVLLLFVCAVASKEHTATLPIILLLTDMWFAKGDRVEAVKKNWRIYIPLAVGTLVAGGFIWKVVSASKSAGFQGTGISSLSYALTQCRVFWVYLRLFVLPYGQNIDYDMAWSTGRELTTIIGFLGITALCVLAWRMRERFPLASYGFFLFLILLLPTSSIIPIKDPIAERRMYLPMLGLVLIACEAMIHLVHERVAIVTVSCLAILLMAIVSYQRNRVWGSEAALWEDTVAKSPNKLRGYGHLVHGLVEEHRCRDALARLDEVSHRLTIDPALLGHWAVAYECVHEPQNALAKLSMVIAQAPNPLTYVDMARNQLALDRDEDALESLNRAIALDDTLESAILTRAQIYERRGDLTLAIKDYQAALALDPKNEPVKMRVAQLAGYTWHR